MPPTLPGETLQVWRPSRPSFLSRRRSRELPLVNVVARPGTVGLRPRFPVGPRAARALTWSAFLGHSPRPVSSLTVLF